MKNPGASFVTCMIKERKHPAHVVADRIYENTIPESGATPGSGIVLLKGGGDNPCGKGKRFFENTVNPGQPEAPSFKIF